MSIRLALYQPDIPQNTGALLRLGACLGVSVDVIEPCGFLWDEKRMRRSGMDYPDHVDMKRHVSWDRYLETVEGRIVLLTTRASRSHTSFTFRPADSLLLGRESSGVPDSVHDRAEASIRIPMQAKLRSLNVALSAAMAVGEALRQLDAYPDA